MLLTIVLDAIFSQIFQNSVLVLLLVYISRGINSYLLYMIQQVKGSFFWIHLVSPANVSRRKVIYKLFTVVFPARESYDESLALSLMSYELPGI